MSTTALWIVALVLALFTGVSVGTLVGGWLSAGRWADECQKCMEYRERTLREDQR